LRNSIFELFGSSFFFCVFFHQSCCFRLAVMRGAELWCGEIVREGLCGFLEVSCGFCTIRSDAYQRQTGRAEDSVCLDGLVNVSRVHD
jgi:hypothetical protein